MRFFAILGILALVSFSLLTGYTGWQSPIPNMEEPLTIILLAGMFLAAAYGMVGMMFMPRAGYGPLYGMLFLAIGGIMLHLSGQNLSGIRADSLPVMLFWLVCGLGFTAIYTVGAVLRAPRARPVPA